MRDRNGITLRQLQERVHYNYSTLSKVTCARRVASWAVTEAYIKGCLNKGDPEPDWDYWYRLWQACGGGEGVA